MLTKAKQMMVTLFLTGALMAGGCAGLLAPVTMPNYELVSGAKDSNPDFPLVGKICEGEAVTTVVKPGYHVPPPPCYYPPCFATGYTVPSKVVEDFSQVKFDACMARHGWEVTHHVCVDRCEQWAGQILQQWFVANGISCTDPAWERCERTDEANQRTVSCNVCKDQL